MLGSYVNLVRTGLRASTASLGASSPCVPGVFAINRARVGVAVLLSIDSIAYLTTVGSSSDDRTGTAFNAAATKLRARRPGGPARHNAIDGAFLFATRLVTEIVDACLATEHGHGYNGTGARLGTRSTGNGAGTPCRPEGHLAINGAFETVASSLVGKGTARQTTVGNIDNDGLGFGL